MPNRSTVEQSLVRILQALHAAVRRAEEGDFGGDAVLGALTDAEREGVVDLYKVVLTYLTSLVDFGKLRRSMETQVNKWLRDQEMGEVAVRALSGDVNFDEVRATLDDLRALARPSRWWRPRQVSHGVDVPRLNLMVFNGMPKAMNEYIQASSRVGRQYLGVVFHPLQRGARARPLALPLSRQVPRVPRPDGGTCGDQPLEPVRRAADPPRRAHGRDPSVGQPRLVGRRPRARHLHDLDRMKVALRPPDQGGLAEAQQEALLEAMSRRTTSPSAEAAELRAEVRTRVSVAVSSIRAAGARPRRPAAAAPGTAGPATTSASSRPDDLPARRCRRPAVLHPAGEETPVTFDPRTAWPAPGAS